MQSESVSSISMGSGTVWGGVSSKSANHCSSGQCDVTLMGDGFTSGSVHTTTGRGVELTVVRGGDTEECWGLLFVGWGIDDARTQDSGCGGRTAPHRSINFAFVIEENASAWWACSATKTVKSPVSTNVSQQGHRNPRFTR